MDRYKTLRNVAIIVVIAAAVAFIPGGGRAAGTFEAALWVALFLGVGFVLLRVYRERRVWIHGLGDRHRAILYGGLGLGVFLWAAKSSMWRSGLEVVWWLLAGVAAYALMEVYRHSRAF